MRSLQPNIHEPQHASIKPPAPLMLLPALSLFPFIRSPLGYDILYPTATLPPVLLPAILGYVLELMSQPARIGATWFYLFLALSFAVSLVRFARRAIGQRRGEDIHSLEAGYSIVTRLLRFLPAPLSEQLLTPAAIGGLGWWLCHAPVVYWGEWQGRYYYGPVSFLPGSFDSNYLRFCHN